MANTRGPQVVLEGYARSVARGGAGRTMRENIAAWDALVTAGLVADGSTVDGSSRNGGKPYDLVIAQFPDEPVSAYEIPKPLLQVDIALPMTLITPDDGPVTQNGLRVIQGYAGSGLGIGNGVTGWTGSFQYGSETFHDHFAAAFNTANRATGEYNNLESVMTIPAGTPLSSNLTNAFTASVHDYGGNGAQAINTYAIAGVNDTAVWGLQTYVADSSVATSGQFTGVREQIECDYIVRNNTTTVRGLLANLSATVPQLNAVSWLAFTTSLFPGARSVPFVGATGTFTGGLVVTGGTSGATGTITTVTQAGATGTLNLSNIFGAFIPGETITDTSTGAAISNGYASEWSFPWSVGFNSGNGSAQTALIAGSRTSGSPALAGDPSQPIQFLYTDNTNASSLRNVSIYADPTFAGANGADLRFDSSYGGPANPTLDNLSYLKGMNAAGTASLRLAGLNGQNQLEIGDDVSTTLIRATNGGLCSIAQFVSVPNGINDILFTGAATGSAPMISSNHGQGGTDSNIGLIINPLGSGVLSLNAIGSNTVVGTGAALATNAVLGHLQIPTCAGPPTGAIGGVGKATLICDSTNHKVYCNDGGGWFALN